MATMDYKEVGPDENNDGVADACDGKIQMEMA